MRRIKICNNVFSKYLYFSRCLIPECERRDQTEFSPYWLVNAIPSTDGSLDECNRFASVNSTDLGRIVESDTCSPEHFDRNTVEPCETYVYENTNTVVYDVSNKNILCVCK